MSLKKSKQLAVIKLDNTIDVQDDGETRKLKCVSKDDFCKTSCKFFKGPYVFTPAGEEQRKEAMEFCYNRYEIFERVGYVIPTYETNGSNWY